MISFTVAGERDPCRSRLFVVDLIAEDTHSKTRPNNVPESHRTQEAFSLLNAVALQADVKLDRLREVPLLLEKRVVQNHTMERPAITVTA
jgi:hypothetical protein